MRLYGVCKSKGECVCGYCDEIPDRPKHDKRLPLFKGIKCDHKNEIYDEGYWRCPDCKTIRKARWTP